MLIIGVCGKAGSGKDTIADILVRDLGFVKVAFADPLKRICKDVYDFTDEQLWGPSEKRNEPDFRYLHRKVGALGTMAGVPSPPEDEYLTPRYALQKLGTEWGRDCYEPTWIEYGLRVAKKLLGEGYAYKYSPQRGLEITFEAGFQRPTGVVISDVRFLNEIEGLKEGGAKLVRVKRLNAGLKGQFSEHRSETEQDDIPDELFDFIVNNAGSLEDLVVTTHGFVSQFQIGERDDGFASMLQGIPTEPFTKFPMTGFELVKGQVDSLHDALREAEPTEFSMPLGALKAGDVDVIPANETPAQERMRGMLEARQRDVDAGKIIDFDDSQKDIPPFKRRKKS